MRHILEWIKTKDILKLKGQSERTQHIEETNFKSYASLKSIGYNRAEIDYNAGYDGPLDANIMDRFRERGIKDILLNSMAIQVTEPEIINYFKKSIYCGNNPIIALFESETYHRDDTSIEDCPEYVRDIHEFNEDVSGHGLTSLDLRYIYSIYDWGKGRKYKRKTGIQIKDVGEPKHLRRIVEESGVPKEARWYRNYEMKKTVRDYVLVEEGTF